MPRTPSARRPVRCTGQSVYEVMLILSCAAMALALFFAAYEYVSLYSGQVKPHKFEATGVPSGLTPAAPATRAPAPVAPAPAAPTPATSAAPATAPAAAPGTAAAPATTP